MSSFKIQTIIFDLAEVYLQGLIGIESHISNMFNIDLPSKLINSLHISGEKLLQLFKGKITEQEYWLSVINKNNYEGINNPLSYNDINLFIIAIIIRL